MSDSDPTPPADGIPTAAPPVALRDLLPGHSAQIEPLPTRGGFWVMRHWRGELPLAVSFWVNGLLGNIVISAAGAGLSWGLRQVPEPAMLFASLCAFQLVALTISLWQGVGVWRSASRDDYENPGTVWPEFAKALLLLLIALNAWLFYAQVLPQLRPAWSFMHGDTDAGPRGVRILADGSELEISGFIAADLEDRLATALAEAPRARLVHLDSPGGRIQAAIDLAAMIKAHGLDTYVRRNCASACTLLLLAGRNRYASEAAEIGFHRASFGATDGDEENQFLWEAYRAAGLPERFTKQVMEVPASSIWTPSRPLMLDAGVLTGTVADGAYALSGFGPAPTAKIVEAELLADPHMALLQTGDPAGWNSLVAAWARAVLEGVNGRETIALTAHRSAAMLRRLVREAPDQPLRVYASARYDVMQELQLSNPATCWAYLEGAAPAPQFQDAGDPAVMLERRSAELVAAALANPVLQPQPISAVERRAMILSALAMHGDRLDKILADLRPETRPQSGCKSFMAIYAALLAKPDAAGAAGLRDLLGLLPDEISALLRPDEAASHAAAAGSSPGNRH